MPSGNLSIFEPLLSLEQGTQHTTKDTANIFFKYRTSYAVSFVVRLVLCVPKNGAQRTTECTLSTFLTLFNLQEYDHDDLMKKKQPGNYYTSCN